MHSRREIELGFVNAIPTFIARRENFTDPVGYGGDGTGRGEARPSFSAPAHEVGRDDVIGAEVDVWLDQNPPAAWTAAASKERGVQLRNEDSLSETVGWKWTRKRLEKPRKDLVLEPILGRREKIFPGGG